MARTSLTLPEIDDRILTAVEALPEVDKAERAYARTLRTLRTLLLDNPAASAELLALDGFVGDRTIAALAGGYMLGRAAR